MGVAWIDAMISLWVGRIEQLSLPAAKKTVPGILGGTKYLLILFSLGPSISQMNK